MLENILNNLLLNTNEIIKVLTEIEEKTVAREEIKLSIQALKNNKKYLKEKKVNIATYLPMNLPLYSLIIYAIIPKLISKSVNYRPSTKTINQSKKIHKILKLSEYNIQLFCGNRSDFFNEFVTTSNVVIFVGKPKNMESLSSKLDNNQMLIYFGVGQNPIVVESDANLEVAANKIVSTILFNYGQDCSKPNIILCKEDKYVNLINLIKEKLEINKEKIKGTIQDDNVLKEVSDLFIKESENIYYGGSIDFAKHSPEPTIIVKKIKIEKDIYKEYYAPIFRIMIYKDNNQLKQYFSEQNYQEENMNITLFGTSGLISNLYSGLVLDEQVVSDVDNGYCEFGGFGKNVSFVEYKGIRINKPILINREITYFYNNQIFTDLDPFQTNSNKNRLKKIMLLQYKKELENIFSDNLCFSYIFGSYAKKKFKNLSDIDMFVCTSNFDYEQIQKFRKWYFIFHYMYGKKPDFYYPGEILTLDQLEEVLQRNENAVFELKNSTQLFDCIFYTQIFGDKKIEIIGDKNKLYEYEQKFKVFIPIFCEQIFSILEKNNLFQDEREYMKALYALKNNDLLYFSNKLDFEYQTKEKYTDILKEIDDGFLIKYLKKS